MSTPTIDEILAPPTIGEAMDTEVLPELRSPRDGVQLPVSNWRVGGVFRALAYGVAALYVQARTIVAGMAAATFGDYVFGLVDAPAGLDGVTDWATTHAKDRYGVTRIAATRTTRRLTITNTIATARSVAPGGMIVQFTATGNRYVNAETYTSAGSDTVQVLFQGEYAVDHAAGLDYLDASGATIILVTSSYPGLTVTNPASLYSDVTQVGAGTGTIALSQTPDAPHSVAVRIDSSGAIGVGTWSTNTDNAGWVSQGAIGTILALGTTNIRITPSAGTGTPPFVYGTKYYFSCPGTDVVTVGRDEETPQELGTRSRAVLPLLAFPKDSAGNPIPISPTAAGYEALARSASSQVKICLVRTDASINQKVHVVVAGQGATLATSAIATLQAFFDALSFLTDLVVVESAATQAITLGAVTVTVKQAQLAAAQAEIQRKLAAYFGGVDASAPLPPAGLIERGYVIGLIRMTAGVTNVTEGTITINAATADYQLATDTIATWSQQVSSAFTWSVV